MSTKSRQVFEYPKAEDQQRDVIQIYAEPVADEDQKRRKKRVRQKARDKDRVAEMIVDGRTKSAEDRIERDKEHDRK